ncbi:PilX N-terminal domain-containing pilus assembly protein [Neobacillus notoginsengisoli]|nr:PilX N-terminal domain-containing pilus assembly protein [Neobacillus notoginsengisoli]
MEKRIGFAKNERGMALVLVMVVMVVVSMLGLGMMGMAVNNVKMGTGERDYQSAYYIAEAGSAYGMNEISSVMNKAYAKEQTLAGFFANIDAALNLGNEKTVDGFEESFGKKPTAKVKIEKISSDTIISYTNDYKITSVGTIDNRSRTVVRIVHVSWKPKSVVTIPSNTVLFARDSIDIANTPITGTVATNSTEASNQVKITGSKFEREQMKYDAKTATVTPEFPAFQIPSTAGSFSGNLLTMGKDMAFKTLMVNSSSTLTINVGDYNRNLIVEQLTLASNAKIKIIGKGKLSIYAKNITLASGSEINIDKDTNKLYVFLEGPGTTINAGIIYGSMYAKELNSQLMVNTTSGIQGHIITGGTSPIKLDGNPMPTARMIFAPNAEITLDATFSGSIIAKSIISKGANKVGTFEFVQINYENSPLFMDTGTGANPVQDIIVSDPVREIN